MGLQGAPANGGPAWRRVRGANPIACAAGAIPLHCGSTRRARAMDSESASKALFIALIASHFGVGGCQTVALIIHCPKENNFTAEKANARDLHPSFVK